MIWGLLVLGALSGASAYLVSVGDLSDTAVANLARQNLTLNAPAGIEIEDGALTERPLFSPGTTLSDEVLEKLRENDAELAALAAGGAPVDRRVPRVRYVRVKEFSFARWPGRWLCLASLIAMVVTALALKRANARRRADAKRTLAADSPENTLKRLALEVQELCEQLEATEEPSVQITLIAEGVGRLQRTDIAAFADAREELTARFGLARMAEVMDTFSGAERRLNRAWSAATDGQAEEAVACVNEASQLLQAPLQKLDVA
jgi:hypothetical protein